MTQGDRYVPRSPRAGGDVSSLSAGWRAAVAIVGVLLITGVGLVAPGEQRLIVIILGTILVGGHVAVSAGLRRVEEKAARLGALMWSSLVGATLLVAPGEVDAPVWCLAVPVVVASVHATSAATGVAAVGLGLAAGGGLLIAGAGPVAGLATTMLAGAGLLTAVERRRGEARDELLRRREEDLAGAGAELRDLRAQNGAAAEGRIVALARANVALQAEVERGRKVLEEALDASRTKTSFLLKISHELRTPLNAIVGYTELLLEQPGEVGVDVLQADLERVLGAAHELLALIDSVLDLARLEAGKFEVHLEEFELHELVHEAVAAVAPLAERGGNKLKLKISRQLGSIRSDRTRLRQVLVQLLGNACKFTQAGLVELRVEPMPAANGTFYLLSVRDTGVGIDPDYLPRLFTPFSQADDSPTRRFGGLGVGLALCRHYCTLLGAEISAESEPGKGSVFRVQIPAVARDPREAGVLVSAF